MKKILMYIIAMFLLVNTAFAACNYDFTCDVGENAFTCPSDCARVGTCGDGTCDAWETAASCPLDCSFANSEIDWNDYTLDLSSPVGTDATSGVKESTCTLEDPENTFHTMTTAEQDTLYELDRMVDAGTWTLNCTATDYASNTVSTSTTIEVDELGYVRVSGGLDGIDTKMIILVLLIAGVGFLLLRKR